RQAMESAGSVCSRVLQGRPDQAVCGQRSQSLPGPTPAPLLPAPGLQKLFSVPRASGPSQGSFGLRTRKHSVVAPRAQGIEPPCAGAVRLPGGRRGDWRGPRRRGEEKLQEDRTPEDFLHRLIPEDPETGRRKTEEQKREESFMARMTQERFPERLSDSENEEPFQAKPAHRSAFVSKGSAGSVPLLAGHLSSKVERSQSCNDTFRDRSKSRQQCATIRTKANLLTGASTPLVGVLSSTQNNRCLSAPDLTADKRLGLGTAASIPLLQKPERSISPESNDSISEELNHFKPIVCSPCTPPKRLPDGRVLSPLIIKSTPRNLTRSLQKPTTYETSPRILKKWEQIFQERQIKKTLSKATLTSLAAETGEEFLTPNVSLLVKEPPQLPSDLLPPDTVTHMPADLDSFPSICLAKLESAGNIKRELEAAAAGTAPTVPVARPSKNTLNAGISDVSDTKAALRLAGSCLNVDARAVPRKVIRAASTFPENGLLSTPVKVAGRKRLKYLNDSELSSLQNGLCVERPVGDPSSLRRGRKRQCKMKHLEQAGAIKRLRQADCHRVGAASPPPRRRRKRRREVQQELQQEEEDRRLALQLQRKFERENRTVASQRGRADQYFLRSKSTSGAK
uniref:RING-type E3 ubiquitin transferase n=1 Tax=Varanus komodoensis TaxID=61221 RepID=A0A8D2J195_VARKO